jgi:hypothetical protein
VLADAGRRGGETSPAGAHATVELEGALMSQYCYVHNRAFEWACNDCGIRMGKGGEIHGEGQTERRQEKVLNAAQVQALRDLHRKVKGSYLQLTQLLDELDLLMRTV